jgi:hypothetical protein
MTNPQQHGGEKALLIMASLAVGAGFGCWKAFDFRGPNPVLIDGGIWSGLFWTAVVSLVYTVAAGMVVSLCEGMKWIAYRGQPARWSDASRIILGAVWPLTLVCCVIVYTFLAVIHRLF